MSKKLGFIGCGNMGKAMIHGVLASGKAQASDILASAKTESSREKNAAELGIRLTADNKSVAEFADILFLAVKPQYYEEVIAEIKDAVSDDEIIVSIAPGKSLSWFDEMFGKSLKVIRTMPNTPAMVGEGMMGVCANEKVSQAELDTVLDLCSGFSKAEVIDEKLMDVVTAVSGSSPAYVFMFLSQTPASTPPRCCSMPLITHSPRPKALIAQSTKKMQKLYLTLQKLKIPRSNLRGILT